MFDVCPADFELAHYQSRPSLPGPNEFLLFSSENEKDHHQRDEKPSCLVQAELPQELRGVPVFQEGDEQIVFVAHVLARVLKCQVGSLICFFVFVNFSFCG
jgi:hypothetical protein